MKKNENHKFSPFFGDNLQFFLVFISHRVFELGACNLKNLTKKREKKILVGNRTGTLL